ncbi:MAG: glutathione synthase/RimK-type ligase-like ATP-grasp enzyme [Patescibacteria group bacterium]|jgi:glutathione synthase/RimK-type ligase-like ATP-grasp enzyme
MYYRLGLAGNINVDKGEVLVPDMRRFANYTLDQGRNTVVFDWKNVNDDLTVSKYLISDGSTFNGINSPASLEELCDCVFLKQLGSIASDSQKFVTLLTNLRDNYSGVVVNDPDTSLDNLSKKYLFRLAEKGFPVIPTLHLSPTAKYNEISGLCKDSLKGINTNEYVLKSLEFGEGGNSVRLNSSFKNQDEFSVYQDLHSPLIAQPMISGIFEGEVSLIFLGDDYSHALRKKSNDFRINDSFSPSYSSFNPSSSLKSLSLDALKTLYPSYTNSFSRVDLIPHDDNYLISEVEIVNPSFYLDELKNWEEFNTLLLNFLDSVYEGATK